MSSGHTQTWTGRVWRGTHRWLRETHLISMSTCPPTAARPGVHVYRCHTDNTHSYYSSALTSDKVISSSPGPPAKGKINNAWMPPGTRAAQQTGNIVSFRPLLVFNLQLSSDRSDTLVPREETEKKNQFRFNHSLPHHSTGDLMPTVWITRKRSAKVSADTERSGRETVCLPLNA